MTIIEKKIKLHSLRWNEKSVNEMRKCNKIDTKPSQAKPNRREEKRTMEGTCR